MPAGVQAYHWDGTQWKFSNPVANLYADAGANGWSARTSATAGTFVGQEARVPYTADYFFYTGPAG